MLNNYIILDFETANFERTSICQIGMIKVIDGEIFDVYDELVLPIPSHFDQMNIQVHGIKPEDVVNAKSFIDQYIDFNNFIEDLPIICHNASFDMSCLNKVLTYYNVKHSYDFLCTLVLCRKLLTYESNALTYLASNVLNFEYKAHDALGDCYATYELIKYLSANYDIIEVIKSYKVGKIDLSGYQGFKRR